MRKFCVLRAILKRTISKKKFFSKSRNLKKKTFLKNMILNEKAFLTSKFLKQKFFVLSDFEIKFLQRVRF